MKTRCQHKSVRHAMTMVWMIIAFTTLMLIVSLGVDYSRVQMAKTQLHCAADAAARAGATSLLISNGQARADAIAVAALNQADGSAVVITASDIDFGNWDDTTTPNFSTSRTPINAIQVRANRTAANGNAIPLCFSMLMGITSCDVHVSAIATSDLLYSGFIGLNGITVKNNLLSASYNSSVNTNPDSSHYFNHGALGSNAAITAKNNEVVGEVVLGPSGTSNLDVMSGPLVLTSPIPTPSVDFSAVPATNPGGVSQNLNVGGNLVLAGGTYYFKSISLSNNANLSFSGPATIYVDGDVQFDQHGEIDASGDIPSNLKIIQRGASSVFGGGNANDVTVTGDITAPQTDFSAKNSATLKGRAIFNSITAKNNAEFYYDQSLLAVISGITQRWPVVLVK